MGTALHDDVPATADEGTPRPKPRVQSVARAMDVLNCIAQSPSGVSARDVAEQLGLPRQVIYHLLHTLTDARMVRKASGSRYVMGLGVAALADGFKRQMHANDLLGEFVHQAAQLTGEMAYVSGWIDNDIVVRASAPGSNPVRAAEVSIGTGGNPHGRASGKLLLAMLQPEEARRYLAAHPLVRLTPQTITSMMALEDELARIRQSWVSLECEEFAEGLACIAVPLGAPPCRLALSISAPIERYRQHHETYVAHLKNIAARMRGR